MLFNDGSFNNIDGTLTTNAQPNITTMNGLMSIGSETNTVTVKNDLNVTSNISGPYANFTNINGTVTTNAQPNITTMNGLMSIGSETNTVTVKNNLNVTSDISGADASFNNIERDINNRCTAKYYYDG